MALQDVSPSGRITAYSLVYVSEISPALQTDAKTLRTALLAIENAARKHNPATGVKGVLLYVAGFFIQWLEGHQTAVCELMQHIEKDTRHSGVQVVFAADSPQMLTQWSMSMATRSGKNDAIGQLIAMLRSGQLPARVTDSVPADIFQGLIAPREFPSVNPNQNNCQVALVGQTGLWSAAAMTYLSSLWKVPIQRTRLIGSQGIESEALLEYIDAVHPQIGPIRVTNFSGDILQHGWVHSRLDKFDVYVLFYSINLVDAALDFTDIAVNALSLSNNNSAKIGLFGRTAQPVMKPVTHWLNSKSIHTQCVSMSLADVANVWQTIEALAVKTCAGAESVLAKQTQTMPPATAPVLKDAKLPLTTPLTTSLATRSASFEMSTASHSIAEPTVAPAGVKPLQLVTRLETLVPVRSQAALKVPSRVAAATTMTHDARLWLHSLLEIEGTQWAGIQWADDAEHVGLAVDSVENKTPADPQVQASNLKNRLAEEFQLHCHLRKRIGTDDESRIVTRYSNFFEVSYGLNAPEGTFVLMLRSTPSNINLAVVLSQMQKRLMQELPIFFQAVRFMKSA